MSESISLHTTLPASATQIYNDWLSSTGHTAFTGGTAEIANEIGAKFTAWDGYISGKITALDANNSIVQTWRTVEFPATAEDSILEVLLESISENQTKVTFKHSNIPAGDGQKYFDGWEQHYIEPMLAYYND